MSKVRLSIGIPAYNEEQNIKRLLESLLAQPNNNYELVEIIVVIDGGTDNTLAEINKISDPRVIAIPNKDRQGKSARQNQMLKTFKGDVLAIFDADVVPSQNLLDSLVLPFKDSNVGLVGGRVTPLPAKTFFEKIINYSHEFKMDMYTAISSDNIYLCHGRNRAFSRSFAEKLQWPENLSSSEDSYSYLACVTKGFKFAYADDADVFFRSPQTLNDHVGQSIRFFNSSQPLTQHFDPAVVGKSFDIPSTHLRKYMIKYFLKNPLYFSLYFAVVILSRILSKLKKNQGSTWNVSQSSKVLSD